MTKFRILPLLVLSLASALAAYAGPVTFQVNMSVQAAMGNFDAATDSVEVRGSFDGWGTGMMLGDRGAF